MPKMKNKKFSEKIFFEKSSRQTLVK